MDAYLSVFNQHINNAGKIALKTVNNMFDKKSEDLIELNKMSKDGIMKIFSSPTNHVFGAYVGIVYYLVNQKEKNK